MASEAAGTSTYDYLVIGGGSGGVASARRAAGYGAKVCVVERAALGGTCVNVGCVPKKVMFNAATVAETIHTANHFGFQVEKVTFDWNTLKLARDAYITRLNGIYLNMLKNNKVDVLQGTASFVDSKTVCVTAGDGTKMTVTAKNILIAVGGRPVMPSIPGVEHCISSDGFFALSSQPKSVAVVGGGYIGVELAGVFNALGTDTHLFTRGEKVLNGFDTMIVDGLLAEFKKQNLNYHPKQQPSSVVKGADGKLTLKMESGASFGPYDQVVFAVGRTPFFEPLSIDRSGVKLDERGLVKVDEYQCTSTPGVFAVGDITSTDCYE
jgi:glutathione reductase (NADPH)